MKLLRFNSYYFLWTLLLFVIEIGIALYLHDSFIRPYFGDFLVVILIYCFIRSIVALPYFKVVNCALLFCYAVEFAQYLNLIEKLGLQKWQAIAMVLGSSFSWTDILCYTCGYFLIIGIEKYRYNRAQPINQNC